MKKTAIKVLALSLVAIMMCFVFASCSNAPKGTFVSESGNVTIEFSGDKVELTYGSDKKTVVEGTFEMDEDAEGNPTIDIELPEPSSFLDLEYATIRATLVDEKPYNAGSDNKGDYIEIGSVKYYKK